MARIKPLLNTTRKDIILKNAAALFRKKGFKASSVRDLAERLGIEAPSLYNHFKSKAEMLREICFSIAEDFNDHMQMTLASNEKSVGKIESLIRFHIQKMYSDFDNVYVANHEWKHMSKEDVELFLAQRKAYESHMNDIIATGIQSGAIKYIHSQITVLTILSAVRGLEFWQRHKKELSIAELEDSMVNHLLNGITK
jgi:AcrR family transcriptional regulator